MTSFLTAEQCTHNFLFYTFLLQVCAKWFSVVKSQMNMFSFVISSPAPNIHAYRHKLIFAFFILYQAPNTSFFSSFSSYLNLTKNNLFKNHTKHTTPILRFGHAPRNLYIGISMNDGEGFLLVIKLDRLESW